MSAYDGSHLAGVASSTCVCDQIGTIQSAAPWLRTCIPPTIGGEALTMAWHGNGAAHHFGLPASAKLRAAVYEPSRFRQHASLTKLTRIWGRTCPARLERRLSWIGPDKTPTNSQRSSSPLSTPPQSAFHPPSTMASECESGDVLHLHPHGTEPLAHIAVDYCPDACHHAPASGEIHVTYDHRGGARWRSRRRFLPGGAVAATIRAPAGDTAGLNYNLYLSSLEGSRDMDEIDFEFLGRDKRAVQTNFHVAGSGGREQIHQLAFDSSDGFHHYAIAWGAEVIEWRIDGELIRREERRAGEPWPEKPMFLYASVWDASDIDEGRWTGTYHGRDAPYLCSYRDVRVPVALSVEEEEEEEECQDANAGDASDAAATAAVEEVDAGAGND